MKKLICIISTVMFACSSQSGSKVKTETTLPLKESDTTYAWAKITDNAEWGKGYNFQLLNFRDTLWALHHEGNWYSVDGLKWTQSSLPNAINNLAFLDYIPFNDALYGLGYFAGNIEKFVFKPEIYKTTNCRNWVTLPGESNLPRRFFYHPFVFQNKIWIIGGEDKDTRYADIWNSTDGVNWIKQKENLPFGKRSGSQIVMLNGLLYLLNNDVWSSADGLQWNKVSEEILKGEQVFGYAALVFDNRIWLLGCNRNGQFSSQVLNSTDGKVWQSQEAPWLPRGGVAAAVYKNRIYMTGGKYGGTKEHPDFRYDNDIWFMDKQ